jgi:putative oxidoreductase
MQNTIEKLYHKDNHDLADFFLRLALAIVFIHQGWIHISHMASTIQFFGSIGLPSTLAYIVGFIEFLGGIMMLLGVWIRPVAWLFVVVMIGAIAFVKGSHGFDAYEFELTLLIASLAVAYLPTGRYSYKRLLRR